MARLEDEAASIPQASDELPSIERLGAVVPGLLYIFDLIDRRNIYANQSLAELLGFAPEQVLEMGDQILPSIVHPDDLPVVAAHHQRMMQADDQVVVEVEYRVRDARGSWRWLRSWDSVLQRSPDGIPQRIVGIAHDVTDRVLAEQSLEESRRALHNSEQRWRSIAENPFDFVVVIDRSYKYTYINFVAPGLRPEDLLGKATPLDFIAPADHDRVVAALESVFNEGRPAYYEVHVPELDRWYSSLVGPIRESEIVTHASILTRETTSERRHLAQAVAAQEQLRLAEAKLMQSAKLEAVGQLAGGVAHDFNNLLTGIAGVGESLANRFAKNDPAQTEISDLLEAVQRGARLTRQLLAFSRQQPVALSDVDLGWLLKDTLRLLDRLIGENIAIELGAMSDRFFVHCDKGQLEQVLLNLAVNARDAMPGGGRLSFQLTAVTLDEEAKKLHPEAAPGPYVLLSVTDSGCGMDAATMARIFEPFFTTKPVGQGTGLGLAVVYGIVRRSGGFILVHSKLGEGCRFEIFLPRREAQPQPELVVPKRPGGSEIVLVVEDEDLVLRVMQRMLSNLGYRVHTATRASEALALVDGGLVFDVLLTDVLLPDSTGFELYRRLAAVQSAVIFMSGYTDAAIGERQVAESRGLFLQKPFNQAELASKVREALDPRAEPLSGVVGP